MDGSTQSLPGPEGQPAAAPPSAKRRAATKRPPITTLEDFFGRRAARAASFLKDLREAGKWEFESEDVQRALTDHIARDKDFSKTTQLIAAAMKERDSRFERPVIAFAEQAIHRRLAENPHFVGVDLDAATSATEKFGLVARGLSSRLCEAKHRAESTNLLLALTLCTSREDRLSAGDAVARLVSALELEPSPSTQRQRAQLVWLAERPKEVRSALELVAPWIRATRVVEERASELEATVEGESRGREAAEADVVRHSARAADLEKELEAGRAEIERLEEGLRASDVHADHDARRMKARLAGLLDGQLRDLVATTDEALSVDPPHVEIAREKLDAILRELEQQVAWLRS